MFEYFFDGRRKGLSRENVLKLDVHSTGYMNAIVFWFDPFSPACGLRARWMEGAREGLW